jgi:hypothetical protein
MCCCCIGGDGQEAVVRIGRAAEVGGGRRRRGRGRGLRGSGSKGSRGEQSGGRRSDASSHGLHHFVILEKVHRRTHCPPSNHERFNYH